MGGGSQHLELQPIVLIIWLWCQRNGISGSCRRRQWTPIERGVQAGFARSVRC
jgi:hypothetical protein